MIFVLAAMLAACATPTPDNRLGTEGTSPDKLAIAAPEADQLKIVEVDGTPLPRFGNAQFYLPRGEHKFQVVLHWCPGGDCIDVGRYAGEPRMACFEAKAGVRYRFRVSAPGPNWQVRVSKAADGAGPSAIDSRCK